MINQNQFMKFLCLSKNVDQLLPKNSICFPLENLNLKKRTIFAKHLSQQKIMLFFSILSVNNLNLHKRLIQILFKNKILCFNLWLNKFNDKLMKLLRSRPFLLKLAQINKIRLKIKVKLRIIAISDKRNVLRY